MFINPVQDGLGEELLRAVENIKENSAKEDFINTVRFALFKYMWVFYCRDFRQIFEIYIYILEIFLNIQMKILLYLMWGNIN